MTTPRAADLPVGAKVEWAGRTYLHDRRDLQGWNCGVFGYYIDSEIDGMIRLGAAVTIPERVLRVGEGGRLDQ